MSVELYFNPLSQPSRAIHALLLLGHIPHNLHVIDLMKQEQNTPEYKKISPTG
jgi:glutathione S-transferase